MKIAITLILLICSNLLFVNLSLAKECKEIKEKIISKTPLVQDEKKIINTYIKNIQNSSVNAQSLCFENLVGTLLYKGLYLEQDKMKAEQLFYKLSNSGYADAQFNFAFTMSKRDDQNPEDVIALMLGVYWTNISNQETSHLSEKTRIILINYLKNLYTKFPNLEQTEINKIREKTHKALSDNYKKIAKTNNPGLVKDIKDNTWDNIMFVVGVGVIAYNLSMPNSNFSGTNTNTFSSAPQTNPWFKWGQGFGNPLNLQQIPI
tara:strand:+ start:216 stop:1001 length:786 start_codon:yes stop_codon:yes gene_type:complete